MSIFRLRSLSRGLGLSPRRRAAPDSGPQPPGDTEPPSVPQNLSATAVSSSQIDLAWDASTDNVAVVGYRIYRDNVLVDAVPINSYSDTGLNPDTEYEYEVSAIDAESNESARSTPDSATTPSAADTEAPSVPQNLSATAASFSQIDLVWDASTDNVGVTGYNIYRDNLLIDTSPTNSYSDTGLASETTYEYEVSAFDAAANESARSAPDSATTAASGDTEAPSVPQNLSATAVSDDQIDLSWDASTDNVGVTGYKIYRDNLLIDTSPTNSYSDTGLAIETTYEYEVSAFDAAANESARSSPDSATTAVSRLSPEFVQRGTAGVQGNRANEVGFTYPIEDVRVDDLFIAVIAVNDRGATPDVADTASGWTKLSEVQHGQLALSIFYRRATGSESGAVTPFAWSSADDLNDVALCQAYHFRYVDWTHGGPFFGSPVTVSGDLTSLGMPTVTTQGENGLAVAACAFSDDLTTALDTPAGATGGTWIAPRDRDSTTTADDASVNLFVAPLATAGTITGGTLSITGSSPQSSRSIAIGFALRGMVDPETTTTLSVSIAAGVDDARQSISTTVVNLTSTTLFVAGNLVGMRFTGLAALTGKTIVQANLQVTSSGSEGFANNGTFLIKGEAADTAAPYAAVNGNISGRSLTTASRTWTVPGWTASDRTLRQRSVDGRSIVQEVTNRPGFGGVVNFIVSVASGGSRQWAAFEHAALQEATLTVRYLP